MSNNAIEVYIHRLRKKIEVGGVRIATVRGLGLDEAAEIVDRGEIAKLAAVHGFHFLERSLPQSEIFRNRCAG